MSGPRPLPTNLKLLKGNPGKRPPNVAEPRPDAGLPDLPRHLVGEARKEWKRVTPELIKLGLLSRIDRAALAMYCTEWGRYVNAETQIQRLGELMHDPLAGLVDTSPQGYRMQSVWLQISNKAKEQCLRFLIEFGMSPSARSRVQVEPQMQLPLEQDATAKKWNAL